MSPDAPMKPVDRPALLTDCDYFAGELSRRLEALADIEQSGHVLEDWTQAAKLARTGTRAGEAGI